MSKFEVICSKVGAYIDQIMLSSILFSSSMNADDRVWCIHQPIALTSSNCGGAPEIYKS